MSIISTIGRKHWKVRALFTGMYIFLVVGSASMVYPFMLMIAGSTKSNVDTKYFEAIPQFLHNDTWLYRKHIEGLFNENLLDENMVYDQDDKSFEYVEPPASVNRALVDEWQAFLQATPLPKYAYRIGYLSTPNSRTIPEGLRLFKNELMERYGKDIESVNRELETEFTGWANVSVNVYPNLDRRNKPATSTYVRIGDEINGRLPKAWRAYLSIDGFFKKQYVKPLFGTDIAEYNKANGTSYKSYAEVRLARQVADIKSAKERATWEQFVRLTLALQWIRVDAAATADYRQFLEAKHTTINVLNRYYNTTYKSFDEVPLVVEPPLSGMVLSDWEAFIAGWKDPDTKRLYQAPVSSLRIHSAEWQFRDYLEAKYRTLAALNQRLGTTYATWADITLPQKEYHYCWFTENRGALRKEFIVRNYLTVAEHILFHGRALMNTVIYCALAVLAALLVNPLAAYALSRYKMPSTYKILLFLMATMAFPPMVTQIPNFLMLRHLNLLNTFAALILPGMASGYSIFLLKGFFDSLPRELYESAELDGASEWTIFWQLTMALSKPILAVIALGAFTGAYSNFMFAFVICQDQKMWTLMVWLYQLQQYSGQAVMYASLIIAAIPTFIIFLFCQNLIMRGIVVPSEK